MIIAEKYWTRCVSTGILNRWRHEIQFQIEPTQKCLTRARRSSMNSNLRISDENPFKLFKRIWAPFKTEKEHSVQKRKTFPKHWGKMQKFPFCLHIQLNSKPLKGILSGKIHSCWRDDDAGCKKAQMSTLAAVRCLLLSCQSLKWINAKQLEATERSEFFLLAVASSMTSSVSAASIRSKDVHDSRDIFSFLQPHWRSPAHKSEEKLIFRWFYSCDIVNMFGMKPSLW